MEEFVVIVGASEKFRDVAGAVGGRDDFAVDVAGVVQNNCADQWQRSKRKIDHDFLI